MSLATDYHKLIVKVYNRITCRDVASIEEIPTESLKFLYNFEYSELMAPLAREALIDGCSIRFTAKRLKSTRRRIEVIHRNMKNTVTPK